MPGGKAHPNYVAVWLWLVGLMAASVLVSYIGLPKALAVYLIFAAAAVKAILVALNYMHLRFERLLIWTLALVPLGLFVVLTVVLLPDIAHH